jgi:hypothetical protein
VHEGPGKSAHSARDAEAEQYAPIDVSPQQPEALRGADEVRDGDRGHGELGPRLDRERRGEQAPDAEAGDSGNSGSNQADERYEASK